MRLGRETLEVCIGLGGRSVCCGPCICSTWNCEAQWLGSTSYVRRLLVILQDNHNKLYIFYEAIPDGFLVPMRFQPRQYLVRNVWSPSLVSTFVWSKIFQHRVLHFTFRSPKIVSNVIQNILTQALMIYRSISWFYINVGGLALHLFSFLHKTNYLKKHLETSYTA